MNRSVWRLLPMSLAAALALGGAACAANGGQQGAPESPETPETSLEATNPWTTCTSLQQATDIAGFDAPALPDGYVIIGIGAMKNEMIELEATNSLRTFTLRKGKGTGKDISGDYNEYTEYESTTSEGIPLKLRRDTYGPIRVATWSLNGFSFALLIDGASEQDVALICNASMKSSNDTPFSPLSPLSPETTASPASPDSPASPETTASPESPDTPNTPATA